MSNLKEIKVKEVGLILDKERHLKFDLNAMQEVEEKYGNLETALGLIEKLNIKAMKFLLWAGLIHEETNEDETYNITIKQVGSWVGMNNLNDIASLIMEAFGMSLPDVDETKNLIPSQTVKKKTQA